MKKSILVLLFCIVSYFSQAGLNNRLAIIYYQDSTSSASYKSLLNSYGFSVTLVEQSSVVGYNFSSFNLIIASSNSNNNANYLTWIDDAHANAIKATRLPVLGICQGGGALLYKLSAWNNGGQGAFIGGPTVKLLASTSSSFNNPLTISLPSDSTLTVVNTSNCTQGTNVSSGSSSTFSDWARNTSYPSYSMINVDSSKYYYFGYDVNTVNDFTADGKKLFVNLVYKAGGFNFSVVTDLPSTSFNNLSRFSYPNPTQGIITLKENATATHIQIVDLQGVEIMDIMPNSSRVDLSSLSNGVYLLKIFTEDGCKTEKILKE